MTAEADTLLNSLADDLAGPETEAIIVGGSYARGNPTPYSDVDLVHFVSVAPRHSDRQYRYVGDRLISIATRTFDWHRTALTQPIRAIFVVPALREARVLIDRNSGFRTLQQELQAFRWEPLQAAANYHACRALTNGAEEVHKLLSARIRNDPAASFAAATALFFDLTMAVAVQRGRLIDGTHTYWAHVQAAVGHGTPWVRVHQQFVALDQQPSTTPLIRSRGQAALRLYMETARLLCPILPEDDRAVVAQVLRILQTALDQG